MRYTDSHEWLKIEGDVATVGITEYAQKELGEIVFVELPDEGSQVVKGDEAGVLESTKAAADVYAPLSGHVIEVNKCLIDDVDKINSEPEGDGWIYKLRLSEEAELDSLMDKKAYAELVG